MTTSKSVFDEFIIGFSKTVAGRVFQKVSVENNFDEEQYAQLFSYLRNRYPYLGDGELSIVIVALLAYDINDLPSYIVSDDMRFKKKFQEILETPRVKSMLGLKKPLVRVTGTIGLLRQLYRRGKIMPADMVNIIKDLCKGTLYITDKLIDELRECLR
jgi:hypothetical protein